ECPFKYYAAHVLQLPEERDAQAWLTPQERGHFVHAVFESFFAEWQDLGRGAITTANVADAMMLFETVAERHLAALPEGDRALQLPIYGLCAQQALDGRHGRAWTVSRAGYIAFKEKTPFTELPNPLKALADGQAILLAVVDAIERGEFPVRPDEPFLCTWCA